MKLLMWCTYAPLILLLVSFTSIKVFASYLFTEFIHTGAIVQGDKGFIWLATTNGLVRHDSQNNTLINSSNSSWTLPFNWINHIEMLAGGKLLLATETHKLWLFDTTTGEAVPLPVDIHQNSIYSVIEHRGMYYLNVPNKLYRFNPKLRKTTLLAEDIHIRSLQHTSNTVYISTEEAVFKITDDKLERIEVGNILAISAAGSQLLVAKENALIALTDDNQRKSITVSSAITALAHSHDLQSVFAITKLGHVEQYQLSDLAVVAHSYPNIAPGFIEKLYHDSSGVLWALSNQGVEKISQSVVKNIAKLFDVKFNAIALTVHQQELILGSYGDGLGTLPGQFSFLPNNINQGFTANGKIVTDLYSYGKILYIATFDGLWQFSSDTDTVSRVEFPGNHQLLLSMKYKDDALYLGTNADGVMKFDLKQQKVEFHIKGRELTSPEAIDSLPVGTNKLWVATPKGIDIVDLTTLAVTKVNSFGENKVIALLEYKDKVFVSTKGDGFFIFDTQGELLSHFAKNITFSYMSLINEEIWISGRPGLYRLNTDTYQLKMVANTSQYTMTKRPVFLNNKVYVGHYGGVIEVPLSSEETVQSKIYISKTIASGKAQLLSSTIDVASSNDVITFELASLDFRPGQKKQFKYQINGGDWHDINGDQLTLTGLSSGNYHLEIMGTNSLGQWSNFKAYADINVSYPWYWHPNSRIIYAVLIIATILLTFWLLYLRSRSISHIHRLLNEEISTNSQSTAIIRRKLIEIQSCIEPKQKRQQGISSDNSTGYDIAHADIQPLISACLAELSTNKNHTAPSSLSGSSLTVALPYLADYFHQQYHVLITLQLDIEDSKVDYAVQSAVYRIIYEAILAAITNGNGGVFAININQVNEKLWLKITDNEQSFAQFNSKINFDMAMYYIRQVANKFNATFHTYDNQEHGSEIILSIPLMKIS